ncbi:MAG TPA: FkbM family methyltransferase [Acidimicrobiales bacterium]|nr:FkbM family methyltransferase [Acidimicrobiales bacterium]
MRERIAQTNLVLSRLALRAGDSLRPLVPPGSPARRILAPIGRRLGAGDGGDAGTDPRSRIISEFARCFPAAFFVQVGSNDGMKLDPLRRHILRRPWSGIMIEPLPYVFEQLASQYRDHPRIALENVAVADHDGTAELFYLPQSADPSLPDWYDALATFRKDVLLKHSEFIPDIAERISSVEVPCSTFESICARHSVARIDLIQIDTEGYDFEVIKLIDLERYRPKLVMFEHLHLGPDDLQSCLGRLRSNGYEDLSDTMDTVCLRVDDLGPEQRSLLRLWRELSGSAGRDRG